MDALPTPPLPPPPPPAPRPRSTTPMAATATLHPLASPSPSLSPTIRTHPVSSVVSSAPPISSIPAKRPAPEDDDNEIQEAPKPKPGLSGRVRCDACGEHISFIDSHTGAFSVDHWDTHLQQCSAQRTSATPTLSAAPLPLNGHSGRPPTASTSLPTPPMMNPHDGSGPPPAKRRRAKRTEDERIAYFNNDPFVARVEPYRVLCGSCNKWIRLRPNSTYCSIPWDSHRKSCLAKNGKINGTRTASITPRPAGSASDPGADDDLDADAEGEDDEEMQVDSASPSTSIAPSSAHPSLAQTPVSGPPRPPFPITDHGDASTPLRTTESRRKNESQRREALEADRLLTAVEPSRVYCSLCQKWVQLRQDSTYCAYPWVQHRAKCIVRNQRRMDKVAHSAPGYSHVSSLSAPPRSSGHYDPAEEDELASPSGSAGRTPPSQRAYGSRPPGRPELVSSHGRAAFITRAVDFLFATTYESGRDQLDMPSLISFLNSSLPPRPHARPVTAFTDAEVANALARAGPVPADQDAEGDEVDEDADGEADEDAESSVADVKPYTPHIDTALPPAPSLTATVALEPPSTAKEHLSLDIRAHTPIKDEDRRPDAPPIAVMAPIPASQDAMESQS